MSELHALYQFSVRWFMDVFDRVLRTTKGDSADAAQRVNALTCNIFAETYWQASVSILQEHRVCLALRLAQLRVPDAVGKDELDVLLGRTVHAEEHDDGDAIQQQVPAKLALSRKQIRRLHMLWHLPSFHGMREHMEQHHEQWAAMLQSALAERHIPEWQGTKVQEPAAAHWRAILVLRALRPDRVVAAMRMLINSVLLCGSNSADATQHALTSLVDSMPPWAHALVLCSAAGFEASTRVDALAAERSAPYTPLAMGSAEGIEAADKAIASAAQQASHHAAFGMMFLHASRIVHGPSSGYSAGLSHDWPSLPNADSCLGTREVGCF
jgi:dynein heavy chain 1